MMEINIVFMIPIFIAGFCVARVWYYFYPISGDKK